MFRQTATVMKAGVSSFVARLKVSRRQMSTPEGTPVPQQLTATDTQDLETQKCLIEEL